MRMPESDTLSSKDCLQKAQRPVVIGFLKRLGILFTKSTPFEATVSSFLGAMSGTHRQTFVSLCWLGYANSTSTNRMATKSKPSIRSVVVSDKGQSGIGEHLGRDRAKESLGSEL